MNEIWDKDAEYSVRSKDGKFLIDIAYRDFVNDNHVAEVVVKKKDGDILHFFSIELEKKAMSRMDTEG